MTLQHVEWEDCLVEPSRNAELERELGTFGFVPPHVRFFLSCPWLARTVGTAQFRLAHLPGELADLVFLAVSQDNSCRFCYAAQRSQLRIMGFPEERIRRLEEASFMAGDDPGERAALDFARKVSRSNPAPSAADRDALRSLGFSDAAIAEIAFKAAGTVMGNRVTTLVALPVELAEMEKAWLVRLFRPIVARVLRAQGRPGKPEFLAPDQAAGPFGYVAAALDGSPAARYSLDTFAAAWSSPLLPQRAKALVFAVVARGLGSKRAEHAARELLAPLGLREGEVDEVLSHLSSPALDPLEAAIAPFARETIRPRPADIQRHGKQLREQLGSPQFLELVGSVALANATVRLSLALCES